MSETASIEFTRRELFALWAAAHHKDQPLLKLDLSSAYHKIETALAVDGSGGPDRSSVAATAETAESSAGPPVQPRRRGW